MKVSKSAIHGAILALGTAIALNQLPFVSAQPEPPSIDLNLEPSNTTCSGECNSLAPVIFFSWLCIFTVGVSGAVFANSTVLLLWLTEVFGAIGAVITDALVSVAVWVVIILAACGVKVTKRRANTGTTRQHPDWADPCQPERIPWRSVSWILAPFWPMLMGWEVSRYRNLEPVGDAFFERLNLSHSEIDDLVEALELDMVRGLDGGYTLQTRGLFKKQPPQFAESDTDENLAEKRQALLAMLREYEHQRDALLDMLKKVAKRLRFDRDEAEQRRVEPASPARSTSEAALLPIEEEENPMTSVLGFDPELEAPLFVSWLTLSGLATEGQPEDIVPAAQNLLKNAATAHWMGISSRSTFQTYSIASALPWYGIWQTSVVGIMAAALFQTNDTGALCDPNQLQKWWSGHSPTLALLAGISLVYRVIMASVWGAAIDFIQSSMKSNEQKGIREAMIIFDPAMTKHHQRRQQLRALSNPATRQESSKVEIAVAGPNPSTPSGSTPPSSSASKAPASPASTPTRQPFAAKDLVKSLIWFRNCTQPSAWVLIFGVSMLAFVGVVLGVLTIWTMVVVIRTTAGSIGLGRDFWAVLHTLLAITGAVARWYVITHPFAGSPHPVLKTKKLLRQAQTGIKSSSLKKHIVKMTWIISLLVLVLALVFVPVYECVAKWISRELWITLVNRTLSALKGLL